MTDAERTRIENYRKARENIGTQEQVAKLLGVSRGTLARRESGAVPLNREAELALSALSPLSLAALSKPPPE